MINLIITIFGVVLVILGFYSMSFGFLTPPDLRFFLIGLFSTVLGVILIIFFGSQISRENLSSTKPQLPKENVKDSKERIRSKSMPKEIKPKPSRAIKQTPAAEDKSKEKIKNLVTSEKPAHKEPKKIKPKKIAEANPVSSPVIKKSVETKEKIAVPQKDIKKPQNPEIKKNPEDKAPVVARKPVQKDIKKPVVPVIKKDSDKPAIDKNSSKQGKTKIKPQSVIKRKVRPISKKDEDEFVKNRLDRLKENYIQNTKDIENLIEERLDSFKGTLNQIKSESKDPSIIWSFDADDVQETMQNTILKANNKILMMYPWVRNIDVSVLKKFMETESRMILQEASLDDDASVELIKLLMDNNVKIRTMPHVHTVAIVADEENGLIISTDPIYESFEVGVVYNV